MSESQGVRRPAVGVLVIALVSFVVLGLPDGGLGVAWPTIRSDFGRALSDLGIVIASGSVGYLTVSGLYGRLHTRFGTGLLLTGGSTLLALGLLGVALAPTFVVVVAAAAAVGAGGGLVDTGMNAHAALAFDIRSINLLHACYGIGATLGPIFLTVSLTRTASWTAGYLSMAAVQMVVLVGVWRRRRSWEAGVETPDREDEPRRAQAWLLLALFFLYTGVEVGTGQWSFTLLTESRGYSTAAAGTWVAIYWGGLTAGRFGLGIVGHRIGAVETLHGSVAVALLGLGLLWLDPQDLGVLGLPIASIGFAAIFPTLISVTPARLGAGRSTRSIGHQLAAANLGVAAIPWILGIAAESLGVAALAPGLFVVGLVFAITHVVSVRQASG